MVGPTRLIRITPTGNRRKDKRIADIRLPAVVGGIAGHIINISLGGASFRTTKAGLRNGDEATAIISFSDCDLELKVRVIAHQDSRKTGYGLAYLGLTREAFDRIQRAVVNPHHGL